MMVLQQTERVTVAAIAPATYTYNVVPGQTTYRFRNFATPTDPAAAAAARRAFGNGVIPTGDFLLTITGPAPAAPVRYDRAGSDRFTRFDVDGTFTLLGTAAEAVAADTALTTITFTALAIPAHTVIEHNIFPADRCTWIQEDSADGNGYHIRSANFYPGTGTTVAQLLDVNTTAGIEVLDLRLGYLGKTGRFVAITDSL